MEYLGSFKTYFDIPFPPPPKPEGDDFIPNSNGGDGEGTNSDD